jgi:hypothetical protein
VPPGHLGWQSSFRATSRLVGAWPGTTQRIEYSPGEIIRLKNCDRELIGYDDTDRTRRMRRQQAARNEILAGIDIGVPAADQRGLYLVIDNGPTDDGESRKLSYVLPASRQSHVAHLQPGKLFMPWAGLWLVSIDPRMGEGIDDP